MSYQDRLITAAYTSPITGTRTAWKYRESFSSAFKIRLDTRRYVGLDGVYYVHLGIDGRDLPMACVFDGEDHDRDAKDFIKTLLESTYPAPGYLEHPVYGVKPVVVDSGRGLSDTVNDAGETIVEVLFQEQTLPPEVQLDSPVISTEKQFDALGISASSDFDFMSVFDTPGRALSAIQETTKKLDAISEVASRAARGNAAIITQINMIQSDILRNVGTLVKSPYVLATQMQQLIGTISSIPGDVSNRITAWKDIYDRARPLDGETFTPIEINNNILASNELVCTACTANMFLNIADSADTFPSIVDALNSLETVQRIRADLEVFSAEQSAVYDFDILQKQYLGQSETLDQLSVLAQLSGNAIRDAAPSLGSQIAIKLGKDYSLLQFVYEYYGNVDDETLERFIDTNILQLGQIILLDKGSEFLI